MINFVLHHGTASLFVGLFVAGEAVLFPAIYLMMIGLIDIRVLIAVAFVATVLSDVSWYAVGRFTAGRKHCFEFLFSTTWIGRARKKVSRLFDCYGPRILVISKFLYGSRALAQCIAGYKKIELKTYVRYAVMGSAAWLTAVFALGTALGAGLRTLDDSVREIKMAIAIIFVIILPTYLWLRTEISRRLLARLFQRLTKKKPSAT